VADLFLVRHAPTSWSGRRFCGRADPALSRAGRRLATELGADLAEALASTPGSAPRIVSSPARRARQTADAIALAVGARHVEVDARWAEADVGVAEGLTFEALSAVDPGLAERLGRGDVAIDWPGGETASSLEDRVASALRELRAEASPTIVVSHAGPLRIAVALASGQPAERVAFMDPGGWVRASGADAAAEVAGGPMLRFRT
jgi:broad specificity phosphatase PhoE